ncbi:hypothetical protein [Flavobacterium sp.]|jgi:hypothetical protein|uniref:hypothetical protein n=1 Tax=Flavobacterium sp. TaxID=239 RepID=UPI0037BE72D8
MEEIILPDYMYMASPLHVAQAIGQIPTEKELETNKKITYLIIGGLLTASLIGIGYLIYEGYNEQKKKKTP